VKLADLAKYGHGPKPTVAETADASSAWRLDGDIVPLTGDSFYRDLTYPAEHRHGMHRLRAIRGVSPARFALLCKDAELEYADLGQVVFLDTETTGLGMGAGTYIFLVGAGFLEGDAYRVRQFFLGHPGDERNFLDALSAFLAGFGVLVTFNGKAFDWPLLEGRFLRHRRPVPLSDPPHLDLLHPARRLWKRRVQSCALVSLESTLLGVQRTEEDVEGWEIPGLYFTYLRRRDPAELERVFYHNVQDILSLTTLAVRMDRVLADPFGGLTRDALDFYSLARVFERAGDPQSAVLCYEEALHQGLDPEYRHDALVRVSTLHKRRRWWDGALAAWERLLDDGGASAYYALIEMAKFYEHVERDYARALDLVRDALIMGELPSALGDAPGDLEHRLARLTRRVTLNRR